MPPALLRDAVVIGPAGALNTPQTGTLWMVARCPGAENGSPGDLGQPWDDLPMWEVSALVALAAEYGVRSTDPVLLRDRANLVVHLAPAPVVARIPWLVRRLRPDPRHYLGTDLAVAGFLADAGESVVTPSTVLPPGPHRLAGRWCTFWTYTPHSADRGEPGALRTGVHRLHTALRHYPGELDRGPLADLRFGLHRLPWTGAERAVLTARIAAFETELAQLPAQPLHGDAHAGNALVTLDGLCWTDFEDTWCGPVEWDLACLARGRPPVPPRDRSPAFELCLRLRECHADLWQQVLHPGEVAETARTRLISPLP